MFENKVINKLIVTLALLLFVQKNFAQLVIDTNNSTEYIVEDLFKGSSKNIEIENIKYTGDKKSIGTFTCSMIYNTQFFSKGLILSTGNVLHAAGPNDKTDKGSKMFINNDRQLSSIAKGNTYDAAILEFDFTSTVDSIGFNFFFASEEYPEYVNKHVNDVFGFFLTEEASQVAKNLALIQPGGIPITVDHVNSIANRKYYIQNYYWDEENLKIFEQNKKAAELSQTFQFDGMTKVLKAGAKIKPGKKYHIKLAIADVGDRLYDSAIFLEAGSFSGYKSVNKTDLKQTLINNFDKESMSDYGDSLAVSFNIVFATDSAVISSPSSFKTLDKVCDILLSNPGISLTVAGHTDRTGQLERNRQLSLRRAQNVKKYLISKGVQSSTIKCVGYGDSKPRSKTDMSRNRRVEFIFKK